MSKEIDEKIVRMKFDNAQFERGIKTSLQSLENLGSGIKASLGKISGLASALHFDSLTRNFSLAGIENSINSVSDRFSAMGVVGMTVLQNLTNSAVEAGKKIVSALAIDPLKMGFQEYETQINAVQTILANTESKGTTIDDVNKALDELNRYADMTIYNFTEMTRNIGTFTAAGVDLDTSVSAIKGIANLAAVSGSNSQQASTAMYQLSQALAAGSLKLQDWNSVVNAGMGGQVFQDALKETARVHGIAIDEMIKQQGSFRETLSSGWISSEILTETLAKFTGDLTEEELKAIGYNEEQIKSILKMGETANDAATKVKTFTQLFDTLKEALQSGWTQSWEILVGDFEEAKELLTSISDVLSELINSSSDSRNAMLQGWKDLGGRDSLIESVRVSLDAVISLGKSVKKVFSAIIPPMTSKNLYDITLKIKELSGGLKDFADKIQNFAEGFAESADAIKTASGSVSLFSDILSKMSSSVSLTDELKKAVEAVMSAFKIGTDTAGAFISRFTELGGVSSVIESLRNALAGVFKIIRLAAEAFTNVFSSEENGAELIFGLVEKIRILTEWLVTSESAANKIKSAFTGVFKIIKTIITAVGTLVKLIINNAETVVSIIAAIISAAADAGSKIGTIFESIKNICKDTVNSISSSLSSGAADMSGAMGIMTGIMSGASGIFKKTASLFEKIVSKLKNIFAGVSPMLTKLGSAAALAFDGIFDVILSVLKNLDFGVVLDMFNTGLFTALTISIKGFFDDLASVGSGASGALSSLKGILDGVKGSLETWQNSLKANILLKIAGAVAVLAASLVALSLVDPDRLNSALGGVTIMLSELVGSLAIFTKMAGMEGFSAVAKMSGILFGLSVSVLLLSAAVVKLSALDWNGMIKGLTGLGVILAELGLFLSKTDLIGLGVSRGIGLTALAGGIYILAGAVSKLASISVEGLVKGLSGIGVILAELGIFLNNTTNVSKVLSTSVGITILGAAMLIFASAVEKLGSLPIENIGKGLFGLSAAFVAIGVFINNTANVSKVISTSVGITILGAAMLIFADAIGQIGSMSIEQIGKGLLGMAVALAEVAVALKFIPGNAALIGAGLVAVAAGIRIIASAVQSLGGMSWEELGKGLLAMSVSLAAVVAALNASSGAAMGAVGLLAAAAAISVFTPALLMLGTMSLGEIGASLLALAGTFAVIGVAGAVLAPLTPTILGLSAALLLLGAGVSLLGIGVSALGAGLAALAVSGVAAIVSLVDAVNDIIVVICEAVSEGVPAIVKALCDVISQLAVSLTEISDEVLELVYVLLIKIIDILDKAAPPLIDMIGNILVKLVDRIAQDIPVITDLALKMIIGFIQAISDNMESIIAVACDVVINFIKGIEAKLGDVIQAGIDFIFSFINGIADGIRDNAEPFMDAMANLVDAIIDGFIIGIKGCGNIVVDAVTDIGDAAVSGLKDLLGIHSPSKVFAEIGKYVSEGFANGISGSSSEAEKAADGMGKSVVGIMDGTMKKISDIFPEETDIHPTITPVVNLDNVRSGVSSISSMMSDATGKTGTVSISAKSSFDAAQSTSKSVSESRQGSDQQIIKAIDELENGICAHMNKVNNADRIDSIIRRIDELSKEIKNMKVVMDSGALVGQISGSLDSTLGVVTSMRKRGV